MNRLCEWMGYISVYF